MYVFQLYYEPNLNIVMNTLEQEKLEGILI